jgi:hypothetical protein
VRKLSMGGQQSARSAGVNWLTPPKWIASLGLFDLDPCCPPHMPWYTATTMLTQRDDGLAVPWRGRVWLNPPYGQPSVIEPWMRKMAKHNHGIALLFARTDTACWHNYVFGVASAVRFVSGRPNFYLPTGERSKANCGAPVALIAYGVSDAMVLEQTAIPGHTICP